MTQAHHQRLTVWKLLYGIFYSAVVASVYLYVRMHTHDGGIALFGALSICIFLMHLLVWPRLTLGGLKDSKICFRGVLYGLTQILILKSQSSGFTSTALVASTMGSVFGVILGRLILKEKIKGFALIAAAFCFAAVFLEPMLILRSYLGILGGFTQGFGFVMARSLMLAQKSTRQSISTGFFISSVLTIAFLLLTAAPVAILEVNRHDLLVVVLFALVIQYGFFYLYKILDAQRASLVTLSRLPWVVSLEHFLVGSRFGFSQILSSVLIAIGAILLLLDANSTHKRLKTQQASKSKNKEKWLD